MESTKPICPVCGAELVVVRQRLTCEKCHRYEEGCCEGGPCECKPRKEGESGSQK